MQNEERSLQQQLDEKMVDLRNEVIMQSAVALDFGHRVILAGLGTVALSIEQAQALFERATERGEIMETDMQRMAEGVQQKVTEAAATVRSEAAVRSTAAVSSSVASLLNRLPGVSIAYQTPSGTPAPSDASPAADI